MPLALLIAGGFLGLLAINGKYKDALTLLGNAVKAPGASVTLLEATAGIILVAAIFRAIELPKAGEAFLILLLVVLMTQEGSAFLSQFEQAFGKSSTGATPATTPAATSTPSTSTGGAQ